MSKILEFLQYAARLGFKLKPLLHNNTQPSVLQGSRQVSGVPLLEKIQLCLASVPSQGKLIGMINGESLYNVVI